MMLEYVLVQNIKLFGNSFAFFQMQHCIVFGFHCLEKDHTGNYSVDEEIFLVSCSQALKVDAEWCTVWFCDCTETRDYLDFILSFKGDLNLNFNICERRQFISIMEATTTKKNVTFGSNDPHMGGWGPERL